MPRSTLLAEKYDSIRNGVVEEGFISNIKDVILNAFRDKAKDGIVRDEAGDEYDLEAVRAGLESCGDEDTAKGFADFLGLNVVAESPSTQESVVEEANEPYATPQEVKKLLSNSQDNGIEIQTHYGNHILPVVEVWSQDGITKVSVDIP